MTADLLDILNHAKALHKSGQAAQAQRAYAAVLESNPNHPEALHLLGILHLQTQRPQEAATLLERAFAANGAQAPAALRADLAYALAQLKRYEEALAHYDQVVALNPNNADAHNDRGNVLNSLKRYAEAVKSYQRAIKLRPDLVAAHLNCGAALRECKHYAASIDSLRRAIELNPNHFGAHYNLGKTFDSVKEWEQAVAAYDTALSLKPNYAEAFNNRGASLFELTRYDEALDSYDRALALRPNDAKTYANRSAALTKLHRFDEALADCDKAIALDPSYSGAYFNRGNILNTLDRIEEAIAALDSAAELNSAAGKSQAHVLWNKALIYLALGRYEEGWPLYEVRKVQSLEITSARSTKSPQWTGAEDVSGKTVFVYWEQGLGDTLQFCRYVPLLRDLGARVIFSVQKPLVRLLKQWEPGVEIIGHKSAPASYDYQCALLSLPLAFNTTVENVPAPDGYLKPDPALQALWRERCPPRKRPRIGLVWSGNPANKNDRYRSASLAALKPLFAFDAEWICLSKTLPVDEIAELQRLGVEYIGERQADFADTAALIAELDLVISVDTSVVHMAGALGKPVWVLVSAVADWRWLEGRDDVHWYSSGRLFRQPRRDDWASVVANVQSALIERFA